MVFEGKAFTHEDCKKCDCSRKTRTGESEFEEYMYRCDKGFNINNLHDNKSKPCGLLNGHYYKAECKIIGEMMKIYRIYTEYNSSDRMMDPPEIHIEELTYKKTLKSALIFANSFIKKNFFHKNTRIENDSCGDYQATDFCSWGKTIYIKEITISEDEE
jgi:hypothetical protein